MSDKFEGFAVFHARLREFMNFVRRKHPKIYQEFVEIEKKQEDEIKDFETRLKKISKEKNAI